MQKITKQELLTLAHLSRLHLDEHDLDSLITQIDDVLTYALRVKDLAQMSNAAELLSQKNRNIFREDIVIKTDPTDILAQAPEIEQSYFVVPVILDTP